MGWVQVSSATFGKRVSDDACSMIDSLSRSQSLRIQTTMWLVCNHFRGWGARKGHSRRGYQLILMEFKFYISLLKHESLQCSVGRGCIWVHSWGCHYNTNEGGSLVCLAHDMHLNLILGQTKTTIFAGEAEIVTTNKSATKRTEMSGRRDMSLSSRGLRINLPDAEALNWSHASSLNVCPESVSSC